MSDIFSDRDRRHMARALELAAEGLFSADPNPRVGCVLARDDRVVGEGWHRRVGKSHAEVLALRDAGAAARGATAYVSLEPCSHFGRTPPCADALIRAGVARVVAAMEDSNPQVSGQGLARLRAAGVAAQSGLLESEARALNPGFVKRMETGLPYVRIKSALSLDGRTAMASGESRWISSPESRADVQRWRARSSAVLTGIGTVLADDPSLNVRMESEAWGRGPVRQPMRVILDGRGRLPANAKTLGFPGIVLAFTEPGASVPEGALHETAPYSASGLDLIAVLRALAAREMNEILVEAGPTLAGAFVAAGLADELVLYLAPHLMGDAARGLFRLSGLERMVQRIALDIVDIQRLGPDMRIIARPLPPNEEPQMDADTRRLRADNMEKKGPRMDTDTHG